jgi:hypothetical protein
MWIHRVHASWKRAPMHDLVSTLSQPKNLQNTEPSEDAERHRKKASSRPRQRESVWGGAPTRTTEPFGELAYGLRSEATAAVGSRRSNMRC